jgi:hypothetical protein
VEFRGHAIAAVFGNEFLAIAEVEKGICAFVDHEDNVTAVTAVAAVGTAVCNVFFASEGDTAVAAVSCFDVYFNMIVKICHKNLLSRGFINRIVSYFFYAVKISFGFFARAEDMNFRIP